MVKQALRPGGHLFMCADPNQGFLKSRLSWKSAGLEVAGRTKKLRRSYRTTRAILEASTGVLGQLAREDAEDYLRPDLAAMEPGAPPVIIYTASPQDSVERASNEVMMLAQRRQLRWAPCCSSTATGSRRKTSTGSSPSGSPPRPSGG